MFFLLRLSREFMVAALFFSEGIAWRGLGGDGE
jgi:hypothetical protein